MTQKVDVRLLAQPSVRAPVMAGAVPALPNFMGNANQASGKPSLASHCNLVSLLTNSNGGFVTQASTSDPEFALNEQFCLARTYAIAKGEEMARRLQGVTMARLESQCGAFAPVLKPHVSALSLKPHDQVVQDVSSFVLTTGMSAAQLAGTAKICLSVGYRTDNLDVALGSALLLTVLCGWHRRRGLRGWRKCSGLGGRNRYSGGWRVCFYTACPLTAKHCRHHVKGLKIVALIAVWR